MSQSLSDAAQLAEELVGALAASEADLGRMPIFVRPLVRRGLRKRTGRSFKEWKTLASELHKILRCAVDVGDAALALRQIPDLISGLERLAENYRTAPDRAGKAMSGDVLAGIRKTADVREAIVRALIMALAEVAAS